MSNKYTISLFFSLTLAFFSMPGFTTETDNDFFNTEFWIGEVGPTGPLFTGPHQYPFICTTFDNGLGQPLIDNQVGIGNAVFPEYNGIPIFSAEPLGYSKNCSIPTRVDYFYYDQAANNFLSLPDPANVPPSVAKITHKNHQVNFVVRLERGTINRFIYGIAMLAPYPESLESPSTLDNHAWNRKLVYKFQGGVGIGYFQGKFDLTRKQALHYDSLKRGYAVAYSSGTRTGTHYNLRLAEETALMLKEHFKETYGKPKYTVGIGASGGSIQQYVIGQNNRELIDAAIPQMSYPDMITQTMQIGDCELMERYFDFEHTFFAPTRWSSWLERSLIEGVVANNIAIQIPWGANIYAPSPGSNECINGWRGAVPSLLNPKWAHPDYYAALQLYRYPPAVIANVKWSHFNDLGNIYPQDANGIAYSPWDNVGVQYGLQALLNHDINPDEFLEINSCTGGWKQPADMILGNYPWNPTADPLTYDPWDQANMNLSPFCKYGLPAPRTEGNLLAMNTAYSSGHVFTGNIRIPIIDMRWYLEPILDMHHSQGSFNARARILAKIGHTRNHVIWFVECSDYSPVHLTDNCGYDPTGKALDTMDEWLANRRYHSNRHEPDDKPVAAIDSCFNGDGSVLYTGNDAWDGILNEKPAGPCTTAFPIYSDTRRVAGGPISDDIFKCALKPVTQALSDGTYGDVMFNGLQVLLLNNIFPSGVCDYSKPDVGKPEIQPFVNLKGYRVRMN